MVEYYLAIVLENNHHIYVLENSIWDLKGWYNMAIEDDDNLDWLQSMARMLQACLW
jgi:hypothetical protein